MSAAASLSQIVPILLGLPFLTLASDIPVQSNFDVKKFEGDWFPIGVVGKDAPVHELSSHKYNVFAKRHTGIILYQYFFKELLRFRLPKQFLSYFCSQFGDCTRYSTDYHEHGQPGIYAENNLAEVATFVVVQTDYSTYAVVFIDTKLELFGRTNTSNNEMKKIFNDVAAANGYPVENISYPVVKKPCYN
nr:neutrophil gelatinase-associated lipocalin-like [Anolis sagrei ordinatus]